MEQKQPLISVIVPVYKVEAYLARCLDSLLAQSHQNLEIIAVDDGSPDNCGAILDKYAKQDARIHVIHQQNGGLAAARNAGLRLATGEYLAFLDSDDTAEPALYETLLAAQLRDGTKLSVSGYHIAWESGEKRPLPRSKPRSVSHPNARSRCSLRMRRSKTLSGTSSIEGSCSTG